MAIIIKLRYNSNKLHSICILTLIKYYWKKLLIIVFKQKPTRVWRRQFCERIYLHFPRYLCENCSEIYNYNYNYDYNYKHWLRHALHHHDLRNEAVIFSRKLLGDLRWLAKYIKVVSTLLLLLYNDGRRKNRNSHFWFRRSPGGGRRSLGPLFGFFLSLSFVWGHFLDFVCSEAA